MIPQVGDRVIVRSREENPAAQIVWPGVVVSVTQNGTDVRSENGSVRWFGPDLFDVEVLPRPIPEDATLAVATCPSSSWTYERVGDLWRQVGFPEPKRTAEFVTSTKEGRTVRFYRECGEQQ